MTRAAKILTVSDSVSAGQSEDQTGPRLASRLEEAGYQVVERRVVSDGIESVASALRELSTDFAGVIVTTGGTGFSPRDLTPEATLLVLADEAPRCSLILTTGGTGPAPRDVTPEAVLEIAARELPGFGEVMRATHVLGPLSRGRSGIAGQSLIVNTPGSPTGALESLEAVLDLLDHALATLHGEVGHHHPPEIGGSTATSSSGPT